MALGSRFVVALLLLAVACGGPRAAPAAPTGAAPPADAARPDAPAAPAPTAAPALATVRVAIPDLSIATLPLAAAVAKGLYRDEGLDVELVQIGGQAALPALLNGEVGYLYGWGAASTGIVQGAPVKVLAILQDRPPHVVVTRASIQTPADLRGQRLASSRPGGTDDQVLQRVLQGAGLREDDVQMVRLGETSLRAAALLAGQVDGAALAQPFTAAAEKEGFHVIARGADVLQVPISIVASSQAHVAAAPDEVRRMLRGVARSLPYLTDPANEPEIVAWAAQRYSIDPPQAPAMVDEQLGTVVASGEAPEAVLDAALESARAQTDRTEPIALSQVFDFTLLRAARQEIARP
ncbi:MAG TPA: ABC transporter substrate-binding protein [Chloroflexota bacterium]|nr:ABC transporter substrate-binding protein [Chloroflexota bacterium]